MPSCPTGQTVWKRQEVKVSSEVSWLNKEYLTPAAWGLLI